MDEDEIYFVDTRNAEPVVVSRGGSGGRIVATRAGGGVPRAVAGNRVYGTYGSSYASPYMVGSPMSARYGVTMGAGIGGLFAGTSPGALVDLVAQVFAAVMPLPTAPTATSDPATDVPNLITYQSALATYAKRDEQVRTLGNLVQKLLG